MPLSSDNPNYLLIGLGGTGGKILKEFKKRLFREHPDDMERAKLIPAIEFLYIDSTEEMMNKNHKDKDWRVLGKDATFTQNEFLLIKPGENSVSQILDNIDNYPGLRHIVKMERRCAPRWGKLALPQDKSGALVASCSRQTSQGISLPSKGSTSPCATARRRTRFTSSYSRAWPVAPVPAQSWMQCARRGRNIHRQTLTSTPWCRN